MKIFFSKKFQIFITMFIFLLKEILHLLTNHYLDPDFLKWTILKITGKISLDIQELIISKNSGSFAYICQNNKQKIDYLFLQITSFR